MRKKLRLAIVFLLIVAVSAGCGATGPGSAGIQKNKTTAKAEVDKKSTAAVFDLAKEDPQKGAEALNAIEDKATYEEALREILDHYYKKEAEKDIETFTAKADKRSKKIVTNYEEAAEERENAEDLDYDVDEILVVFESSVSDSTIQNTVEDERCQLQNISRIANDRKMASVEKSLEYTVSKAGGNFSSMSGVAYAQPNYKYTIADEEKTDESTETLKDPEDVPIEKQTTNETNALDLNKENPETEDPALEKSTEKGIRPSTYSPSEDTTNPRYEEQWFIENIGANLAWTRLTDPEITATPRIKVAVIDTGVDAGHEDLNAVINTTYSGFVDGEGYVRTGGITDSDGHGTHVCGIIAAEYGNSAGGAGVASVSASNDNVDIIAIDAYDEDEESFFTSDVAIAIYYARLKDARLINMSLTGPGKDTIVEEQIEAAYYSNDDIDSDGDGDGNILCICAAGNEHTDAMRTPSDVEETISVMASSGTATPGSGSIDHVYSNYGYEKDLLAPGSLILSTIPNNSYASWSGTSMAAPVVTAVAAMVLSANSSLSPRQIKNILYSTATGNDSFDRYAGYGKIDADAAVESAIALLQPGTVATGITLNRSTMKLAVGTERSLEYKIEPAAAANTSVEWVSSNPGVAEVHPTTGKITGINPGTTTITATAGGVNDTCTVTVFDDYPNSIAVNTSKTGRFTEETRIASYGFYDSSNNYWSADWNTDGYSFRGTAGKKIRITMEILTNNSNDADYKIEPFLILRKSNEYPLAYDMDTTGRKAEIVVPLTETGTYYIDAAQAGNENGTYRIKIEDITYPAVGTKLTDGILIYKVMSGNTLSVTGVKSKKIKYAKIATYARVNGKKYYITSIGKNAFKKCSKLSKITVGSNIKSIGSYSLYGCKKLKTITINGKKIKKVGKKALKGVHKYAKIKVPKSKLKAYKKIFKNKGQKKTVKIVKK
jgi:subtilisin family serine protease